MAREKWSSSVGFILASIGSAVGIGNIWRFPYIAGMNGGGAFLIPYIVAVFLFGLSLMILEFALGRHFKISLVPAFSTLGKTFRRAGIFLIFIMVMILGYYFVVTGWVLAYFFFSVFDMDMSFSQFTGSYLPLLSFLISVEISFLVVRAGIREGIEKLSRYLIPLLFAMLLILVAFSLTLPGAREGIGFYLNPDFSKLSDPFAWTAALGQAFFSLSVGLGVMLTYASYMRNENIVKSATVITVSDLFVALLAGIVIFPLVFSFGVDPASGAQLTFVVLPSIFHEMSFGFFLGPVFFLLLFLAALTSAISFLELPVATLIDSYGFGRKRATATVSLIVILIGLPSALSYTTLQLKLFGAPVLDLYDILFGTFGIIVAGLVITIAAGWFIDPGDIFQQIGGGKRMQKIFISIIKYFIPVVLAIVLVARIIRVTGLA